MTNTFSTLILFSILQVEITAAGEEASADASLIEISSDSHEPDRVIFLLLDIIRDVVL